MFASYNTYRSDVVLVGQFAFSPFSRASGSDNSQVLPDRPSCIAGVTRKL